MASNYTYNATYNHSNASNVHQPTPYGSGDPYYNESTGFITPSQPKKGASKWVKIGIPIGILVIAGAVVGIVLGLRAHNKTSSSSSSGSSGSSGDSNSASGAKNNLGLFATATDSQYMLPIYPSTVRCLLSSRVAHAHSRTSARLLLDKHRSFHQPDVQNLERLVHWVAFGSLSAHNPLRYSSSH